MKKIICLSFAVALFANVFCQDIFIGGENKNRLLTWNDFTGKPDKSSPYEANTYWGIMYGYKGVSFIGDTAKLTGLSVTLKFDETKSWVKKGSESAYLLKHEQGHFDIGFLCHQEIISRFNHEILLRSDFQNKARAIFTDTMKKYHEMQLKYDEETNHSKNKESQEKWNVFLANTLKQ